MRQFRKFWHLRFILLCLASSFCLHAQASNPLPPRFSANAYASDYTVGNADFMIPVNSNFCTHNLYLDPMAEYGTDNDGYVDLGLGYRWIQKKAAILGGYLFVGRDRVDNNAHLWVFNPGVEALGSRWDAHLNAYLVAGDRNKHLNTYLGSELGFDTVHFAGHSQFDSLFDLVQHVGHGADVHVGYQLFPGSSLKGYLGSYFFAPAHTGNVWGGAAGLEYWLHQNVKVFAAYNYDNIRHSTGALGLGVEFGGARRHRSDPYLEERLTDPVKRYLAELGHGSVPSRQKLVPSTAGMDGSSVVLIFNNIAFFSPNGSGGDCSFENPCGPGLLTQAEINRLQGQLPGTHIYLLGPGTYLVPEGTISLNGGQSLEGRTNGYRDPTTRPLILPVPAPIPEEIPEIPSPPPPPPPQVATEDVRPVIEGSLALMENGTIDGVILEPTKSNQTGVDVSAGDDNMISQTSVGAFRKNFSIGILVRGTSVVTVDETDVYSNRAGFNVLDKATAIITRNIINASGTGTGINVLNQAVVNVSDSTINSDIGIDTKGSSSSTLTVEDSTINSTSIGVTAISSSITPPSTVTLINNVINVQGSSGLSYGIYGGNNGMLFARGNLFNVSNPGDQAYVLNVLQSNRFQIDGGALVAVAPTASIVTTGSNVVSGENFSIANASCMVNGMVVECP
jgi:hypothetical protein